METPLAHIVLYGPPGTGKSELASSIPGTKLIGLFDPIGHGLPYLRRYANKRTRDVVVVRGAASIIDTIESYDKEDTAKLCSKLWHFGANLQGKQQFDIKRTILVEECVAIDASVFIFDSLTLFTTAMRILTKQQGIIDDEQAAYAITDYVEQLCASLASLPITTVLIAHISDQNVKFRGQVVRKENYINAPGRMARNIKSMFSDVWYCFVDDEGKHYVQTQTRGDHEARNTFNSDPVCEVKLNEQFYEVTKHREPILWI